MDPETIKYIKSKRKKFMLSIAVLCFFGFSLYFYSFFLKNVQNEIDETAISGGLFDIVKKIDTGNEAADTKNEKSSNILKKPVFVEYQFEDNKKLHIRTPIKINDQLINDCVFNINEHGDTIYSTGFISNNKNLTCKGTMKKGSNKFLIYFCGYLKH